MSALIAAALAAPPYEYLEYNKDFYVRYSKS